MWMRLFFPDIPIAPYSFWTLCKSEHTFNTAQPKSDQLIQFLGLKKHE